MLLSAEPDTVDPRYASDALSSRASRLLHRGLFRLNRSSLAPEMDVARAWHYASPTELEVGLDARRFHSGRTVQCADVEATLGALKSPDTRSRAGIAFRNISRVICRSNTELTLQLKAPQASLLADLAFPILRADEAWMQPSDTQDGLGPYRVASREPGTWTLVPAFPGEPHAPVRSVRLHAVGDENARALRLLSGRADVASGVMSPMLADALAKRGMRLRETEGANLTYIVARTDRGRSADVALRRYFRSHTPRAEIVLGMLGQHATLAEGVLPPRVLGRPTEREAVAPSRAPSSPFPTELLVGTDRVRVAIARAMADAWAKDGVIVEVVPLELGVLLARLGRGEFSFAMLQLPDLTEPGLLRSLVHSAAVPPVGMNRSRYANTQVDALLDRAEAELDPAARRALYEQVEMVLGEELPLIPLWRERHLAVLSARAEGYAPGMDGHWEALCDLR